MDLPKGHRYIEIKSEEGFATNADYVDQKGSVMRQMRGLRNNVPGLVAQRDFGTEQRFVAMPVEDGKTINTISDGGGGVVLVSLTNHGYSNGDRVYISGVISSFQINGVREVANIQANAFELAGLTFTGTYTSGGVVGRRPIGNKLITNVANNGSGLIRVTVPTHGYATGNRVFISGVEGTVEANGNWASITKIDANTFDLVGSTFTTTWAGNGVVMVEGKGIYTGTTLNDPTGRTTHEIVVGIDSSGNTRVFIDNSTDKSGAWEELTRSVTMKVNDTAGATDLNVDVNTIAERGVTIVPKPNEFKDWIAVNSTNRAGTAKTIEGATNATPIVVTITGHGYENGDIVYGYQIQGLLLANGYWKVANKAANTFQLQGSIGAGQPAWTSGSGLFKKVPSVVLITANTGTNITSNAILGVNGQDWKNTNAITLYRTTAGYYGLNETLGTTPHFRFNGVDDQRKVNIYFGASRQALEFPYNVQRSDARSRFLFFTTHLLSLTMSVYAERGGAGLSLKHRAVGLSTARLSTNGYVIRHAVWEEDESEPWAFFDAQVAAGYFTDGKLRNVYVTVVYGYEESDPITTIFLGANVGITFPVMSVNPAKMPKGFTGFKYYVAEIDVAAPDVVSYRHSTEIDAVGEIAGPNTGISWLANTDDHGGMIFTHGVALYYTSNGNGLTIDESLGHAPDVERAVFKPKFAIRAARSQGGIMAVNEDDRTVRFSSYSEDAHMDDIFTEQITDINGNKQKVFLGSRGELLGMVFAGVTSQLTGLATGVLFFFKQAEIEFFDFSEGKQGTIEGDFIAVDSLCGTPYGIVFGGNTGIWFIPTGQIYPNKLPLNEAWRNLYDGTLKTDDGTASRVTDAARQALKIGYNPYFNEIWCRLEVRKADNSGTEITSFRYSLTKGRWIGERKLATATNGEIRYFSSRSDGTMTLGCPHALLKYPRLT